MAGLLAAAARMSARTTAARSTVARSSFTLSSSTAPACSFSTAGPRFTAAENAHANPRGFSLYVWGGGSGWLSAGRKGFWNMFKTKASKRTIGTPLLDVADRPVHVDSPDDSGFRDLSFGHEHGAFVTGTGDVYTYGAGEYGQLGVGGKPSWIGEPQKVEGLPPIVQVACGQYHTIALAATGEMYSFGRGCPWWRRQSVLGTKDTSNALRPRLITVPGDAKIAQISAGSLHNVALTTEGAVFSWGQGQHGRLGHGSSFGQNTPTHMQALQEYRITQVSCGSSFNLALDDKGHVYSWGRNEKGQLGIGQGLTFDQYAMEPAPQRVDFALEDGLMGQVSHKVRVKQISAGYKHALALSDSGRLYTWGQGQYMKPNLMLGEEGWLMAEYMMLVGAGDQFCAASDSHGRLLTWGQGTKGCLGQGDRKSRSEPTIVPGFGTSMEDTTMDETAPGYYGQVERILAGHNHCAVLTSVP